MRGFLKHLMLVCTVSLAVTTSALAKTTAEARRLEDLALSVMLDGQLRVMRVADPIRTAGAPLCGNEVGPVFGAFALDQYSLPHLFGAQVSMAPFVDAVQERFRLGRSLRVVAVLPGSPADHAGLRRGDRVTRIAGKKLRARTLLDALKGGEAGVPLQITVERLSGAKELEIQPSRGCAVPARFMFGADINAYATRHSDLTGMYVFSGMLRFLPSDDDLAVVMGHELAHLILRHNGAMRTSRRFEADADYLGLYLAARAGFDISKAPELWDRFTRMSPYAMIDRGVYSHPTSPARALALQETLAEIADKRARGEPLLPEHP